MKRILYLLLFVPLILVGCLGGNSPDLPPIHPMVDVKGKVVDELTGEGLYGVEVQVRDYPTRSDLTADDGSFFLPLVPAGRQVIIATLYGYETKNKAVDIPREGIFEIAIELSPFLGKLVGYVFDENEEPVSGAKITLDGNYHATSGDDGSFTLSDLPVGKFIITVEKAGFLPHSGEVEIKVDSITTLEITLSVLLQNEESC
ncbi:MAG TPA: carboxypeptidase regulatory-like domain-containing protein [Candidatus Atribacteria bacterium]|nr:carboxypeptidase regulatory-like domain-containing protein [Candidatus Atribacteria bacterium]